MRCGKEVDRRTGTGFGAHVQPPEGREGAVPTALWAVGRAPATPAAYKQLKELGVQPQRHSGVHGQLPSSLVGGGGN